MTDWPPADRKPADPAVHRLLTGLGVAALVITVGGVAVFFSALSTAERTRDLNFVAAMTQHHLQGIDLAERLNARLPVDVQQDPAHRDDAAELRSLTLDILTTQQDQVGQMRGWQSVWNTDWNRPGLAEDSAAARQMGLASRADLRAVSTLPLPAAERLFLRLMTRHHRGALRMITGLTCPCHRVVRDLAAQMQVSQQQELDQMDALSRRLGQVTEPDRTPPDMPGMSGM